MMDRRIVANCGLLVYVSGAALPFVMERAKVQGHVGMGPRWVMMAVTVPIGLVWAGIALCVYSQQMRPKTLRGMKLQRFSGIAGLVFGCASVAKVLLIGIIIPPPTRWDTILHLYVTSPLLIIASGICLLLFSAQGQPTCVGDRGVNPDAASAV